MTSRRCLVLVVLLGMLWPAACSSSDGESVRSADGSSPIAPSSTGPSPTTTLPPPATTLPWSTAVPTTTEPRLVEIDLTVDDGSYDSLASMAHDSAVVVLGDVTDVRSLGRPDVADERGLDEYVMVSVAVTETLTGDPLRGITFAWKAFQTEIDGHRTGAYVTNGVRTPQVGDRLLLFLDPADRAFAEHLGADLTHQLVRLDGIWSVDRDVVVAGEAGSPISPELVGRHIDVIRTQISDQ